MDPLVVTLSSKAGPERERRAERVAARLGVPWVKDRRDLAGQPVRMYRIGPRRERLVFPDGSLLEPHPGTWIQKMPLEHAHPFARALGGGQLRVLDATAGLGQDALHAAGLGHEVLAVERQPVLATLLEAWLRRSRGAAEPWAAAAARIRVVCADAAEALALLPAKSFDVVYFDPMFGGARAAAPGFEGLRREAWSEPVSARAFAHARRVASRVLVKAPRVGPPSVAFNPLELSPAVRSRTFTYWAWVQGQPLSPGLAVQ